MAEENQVEQTTETKEEEAPQVQETPQAQTFTQDEVNNIVERRLAKERGSMFKKLGVDDIDVAINAVKTQKEAEEKQRIQKGEFEEILRTRTQEHQKEKSELENQLRDIKINKSLLESASKHKAINASQVVDLLKNDIKLNETGNVEILDKNGIARYNKQGELLTTDELVQEFLTQNPHFVSATPSGSGSVSNVDRQELNKSLNLSELDFNNPEDRKKYAQYKKQRDSQPRVINANP
jgi:Zn-dependent M16 (insulinase) family peptidase|tara:strand:+ start:346 stop:1056 length:711 start_codon:yes stop_codon:yes gene_type:complete